VTFIESVNGTRIALDRSGSGPSLVIVVGAFCDRSTSKPLAALLAPRYTVYEYDRRGRGDSGNSPPSSIQSEIQDLAAVVATAGEAPFVYGHSSGGALALEAAADGLEVRGLAVYEPPYTGDNDPGPEFGRHLDQLVAAGHRDQAAEQWLAMTGAPPTVIASIKGGPGWPHLQALAHTLSQDLRLGNDGRVPTERLNRIDAPVLVMAGEDSPPWAAAAAATLTGALPHAGRRTVGGQQHVPAAPVVAAILQSFFR
jgi:pimeloyl-ACP methyl ester carboxylesterase